MSRTFISFLGTSDYIECNYVTNDEKLENVRFIQEALTQIYFKEGVKGDRVMIITTQKSMEQNWEDGYFKDSRGVGKIGLKGRLEEAKRSGLISEHVEIENIEINEGANENEIWFIFNSLFNAIQMDDEILFDITHAFRSIPMLAMVILHYSGVLKHTKLKGIYYGAFESIGSPNDVKQLPIEQRNVPIYNLTSFAGLLDWTIAINSFLKHGIGTPINELTETQIRPILKATQGNDKVSLDVRHLSENLYNLTLIIQTSRYIQLVDYDFDGLRDLLNQIEKCVIEPFNPVLKLIPEKIKNFENKNLKNGFHAVQWCMDHDLIQQGYTFLQETLVTLLGYPIYGINILKEYKLRHNITAACNELNKGHIQSREKESNLNETAVDIDPEVAQIISKISPEMCKELFNLSNTRNDINHCGCRPDAINPLKLKKILETRYKNISDYYSDQTFYSGNEIVIEES